MSVAIHHRMLEIMHVLDCFHGLPWRRSSEDLALIAHSFWFLMMKQHGAWLDQNVSNDIPYLCMKQPFRESVDYLRLWNVDLPWALEDCQARVCLISYVPGPKFAQSVHLPGSGYTRSNQLMQAGSLAECKPFFWISRQKRITEWKINRPKKVTDYISRSYIDTWGRWAAKLTVQGWCRVQL